MKMKNNAKVIMKSNENQAWSENNISIMKYYLWNINNAEMKKMKASKAISINERKYDGERKWRKWLISENTMAVNQ